MDLSFFTTEQLVGEIKNRFDIFVLCGTKIDPPPEDLKGLLNTSVEDSNSKYKRLELDFCGKNIFGSLGLLEIVYNETKALLRENERNVAEIISDESENTGDK